MNTVEIIRIDPQVMKKLCQNKDNPNRVYFDKKKCVRDLYWGRFKHMIGAVKDVKAGKVLELGCGEGVFLPSLCSRYGEVSGIDLDISVAKELMRAYPFKNITLYQGDALEGAFPNNEFDIIFAASVLEHIKDLDRVFIEIRRILKKGGKLVFSSPTENLFYGIGRRIFGYIKPGDHHYSANQIRRAAEKYLHFEKSRNGPIGLLPGAFSAYVIFTLAKNN